MNVRLAACLMLALPALPASAAEQDHAAAMQAYVAENVAVWSSDPVLVDAIRAQNARHATLGQSDIDALDLTWRAEVDAAEAPMITAMLETEASQFLRARVAESGGVITEVFVMDFLGLNVATSDVTSDYWQGDEEKFSMTYPKGADAVHVSELEFDESTQTFQAQISIAIADPATGEVIGAMTVGLEAETLF